jgi:hypothetical protein
MDAIHVQAPDGSVIQFPAGTPDATINGVMSKEYGNTTRAPSAPEEMKLPYSEVMDISQSTDGQPTTPPMSYWDQMRHVGGAFDNAVRAVGNGIPFMDRIAAAGGAATGVGGTFGDYSGNLERERARNKALEEAAPLANTAAHVVGGALVPMGAVGAAARGTSLLAKTLMSAGTGAAIGGAQGLSDTQDLTNIPDAAKNAGIGAGQGFAVGGILPSAGRVLGKGYNLLADALTPTEGMSRGASKHLAAALLADTAPAVQQRMGQLGNDAMLADAGPAFLGKAQGATLNSDEGRSILGNALTARNEGTNQRIMGDVNRALGPAEDPQTVTNAIREHRTNVDNRAYLAALGNAPDVQTAPILQQIDDMIPRSVGMERRALTNLREMMMTTERRPLLDAQGHPQYDNLGNERFREVPVSQNDAEVLHKIKGELDNVIEYDAPGLGVPAAALTRQQGALKHLRGELNGALEDQVPGYLEANRQSAALARRGTAVDLGTQYLGSGKTTASPGRFADEFQRLQPGEQIAFAKGSRGNIERVLGTKANDLQALRGELQGEGGWNTDKIATVHGQPAADELTGSVDRNLKFRDTYNKVVENSQTAQRQAAARAMKPEPSSETPLLNPNMSLTGFAATLGKKTANAALNAMRPDSTKSFGEIARILSAQGPERDRHLAALVDALGRHSANAQAAGPIGNRAALAAALLGNEYLHGRSDER